jgi:hypothetical protein
MAKSVVLNCIVAFVVVVGVVGCQRSLAPVAAANNRLRVDTKSPGIMKRYNSFYVADVAVYSVEGEYLRRIEDREVDNLAQDFRSKLIHSLGNRHSPVPVQANKSAVIKVNLTDVYSNGAAFQVLPGIIVPNAMRGGGSIDATVLDSVTNEEIAHMRDTREGARQGYLSGFGKWDGVKTAFNEWAQILGGAVTQ